MPLRSLTLDDLTIDDERSLRHVAIYADLKRSLARSGYRFQVLPEGSASARWDRAVFLNLTFWDPSEAGDVLVDEHVPADVVAHVAWHHLARRALDESDAGGAPAAGHAPSSRPASAPTAEGLFLGESIASAFDLYLVGRLLGHSPGSEFLETQVPAMADVAEAAGLDEAAFASLLGSVAKEPERAFEDLRQLLFDAATTLVRCRTIGEAASALEAKDGHRFGALLHHYELSNWVLYARAYAAAAPQGEEARADRDAEARRALAIDAALRSAPVSLDWLTERWLVSEAAT
jgi:hypothetical protein